MTVQELEKIYNPDLDSEKGKKPKNPFVEKVKDKKSEYCKDPKDPKVAKCFFQACLKSTNHQRRIHKDAVEAAANILLKMDIIHGKYSDFDALYDDVRKAIIDVKGIGDLTVYDTALCLGYFHQPNKLEPKKYVYYARGTKKGLEKLLDKKQHGYRMETSELRPYFKKLTSREIEDCLCIYKDCFEAGSVCDNVKDCKNDCGKKTGRNKGCGTHC